MYCFFRISIGKNKNKVLKIPKKILCVGFNQFAVILGNTPTRYYSLSTYAKFSEKLTFLTPMISNCTCACQGVRNVSFSENFA